MEGSGPVRRREACTKTRRRALAAALTLTIAGMAGFTAAAPPAGTVLVLGDSLSAGYGVPAGQGWVDLLARKMAGTHPGFKVVNASISGETTFGGLERLPRLLKDHAPSVVVVELGANDGLRGMDLALTKGNLERIVSASRNAGAKTLVVGMRIPPNYGPVYTKRFFELFGDVAKASSSAYVPFLLDGLAGDRGNFQDDGIHPVGAAQPRILENVLPSLSMLLGKG